MKVKSFVASRVKSLQSQTKEITAGGFNPKLAFVFSSVEMGLDKVRQVFEPYSFDVFGMSTCGEIFYDGQNEGIFMHSAVVSLVEADQSAFSNTVFEIGAGESLNLGEKIGRWGKNEFSNPGFILGVCGIATNGQEVMEGIQKICGNNTAIFGGVAGDDARFENTYVFDSKQILDKGAVVTVFDMNKIDIKGLATSGWVGIGSDKLITRAEGNLVYTIDNEPALQVYKDHLNISDDDLPEIGVEYPLLIKKDGREILRAVIGIDKEEQSVMFAGTVPEGATVTFSTSPGFEVVNHTKKDISQFFESEGSGTLLLLFSCMARHKALGPIIIEELEEAWEKTHIPIAGFFTYGEIGISKSGVCEFYNETFTLAVISEKESSGKTQ